MKEPYDPLRFQIAINVVRYASIRGITDNDFLYPLGSTLATKMKGIEKILALAGITPDLSQATSTFERKNKKVRAWLRFLKSHDEYGVLHNKRLREFDKRELTGNEDLLEKLLTGQQQLEFPFSPPGPTYERDHVDHESIYLLGKP